MTTNNIQEWLSMSLHENPDSFGALYECHSFHAQIPTQIQEPASISPVPRPIPRLQRQKMQSELEVQSYLNGSEMHDFDLIVVAFAKPPKTDTGAFPLPISSKLFDRVTQALDTSPAFLAVMHTGVASFLVSPRGNNGKPAKQSEHLIIQQTRSHSHFSMSLTVTKTGKTRILIFGAQAWSVSQLFDYLESANLSLGNTSIYVPISVLELQAQWFTETMNSLKQRIGNIEDTTGMRKSINHQDLQEPAQDWKELDMLPITGELSSLLSRISFLKMQAETALYLIQMMHQHTGTLADTTVGSPRFRNHNDEDELFNRIESARGWFIGLLEQCNYLSQRASAQIETDYKGNFIAHLYQVYSLLASQNSFINIGIARASNVMAELSRSDNQAMLALSELSRRDAQLMIEIARDSRSVALATARDSASMRVIAIVTILFLPATFTATFFSTTFFNFLGPEGPKASPWIWIYVVATGVLTIIIQIIWVFMSHRSQARILSGS